MTGTGAYCYITWAIWLRHCLNGRQDEYDLKWPRLWYLPEVIRVQPLNGVTKHQNGVVSNGHAKKH